MIFAHCGGVGGGRDKAGSFQELSINQGIKHTESLEDMHVVSFFMDGIYFAYD